MCLLSLAVFLITFSPCIHIIHLLYFPYYTTIIKTPLPLQPQRKKKPHQIFRRAPTSLVNNQISTLHPLTLKTFHQQIAPYYLFPITFYQLSSSSILSDVA